MFTMRELRHLDLLANSHSIAEAADRAGVSPSAISQALTAMEKKLNCQIFVRRRGHLTTTRAGKAVLRRAHSLLTNYEALALDIDAIAQGAMGMLRFGIGPAVANLLLNDALELLFSEHGTYLPRFEVDFWDHCHRKLLEYDLDFFIGGFPSEPDDPRFEYSHFYSDEMTAIVRADHPIRSEGSIDLASLVRYPVLAFNSRLDSTWRALHSQDDLEYFHRNVPASVMPDPLQFLPLLRKTNHVLLVPTLNWRLRREGYSDLVEMNVERLRGVAHMYFVRIAGADLPDNYHHLEEAFRRVLRAKREQAGVA